MQKTIELNWIQRYAVVQLLESGTKGDLTTARTVREVRRGLKLHEAKQRFGELLEQARTEGRVTLDWEDLAEVDAEPVAYALDSGYLQWLQEALVMHDWSKTRGQDGAERSVPPVPVLLEAAADVADTIAAALADGGKEKSGA